MYYNGIGVERDEAKGREHLRIYRALNPPSPGERERILAGLDKYLEVLRAKAEAGDAKANQRDLKNAEEVINAIKKGFTG